MLGEAQLDIDIQRIREDERTRISREIHDELGQQLTALKIETFLIKKKLNEENRRNQRQLTHLISQVIKAEKAVGQIALELRSSVLNSLRLTDALDQQAKEFEKLTGLKTQLYAKSDLNFGGNVSACIFKVCQEALNNIARHAKATKVEVILELVGNHLSLVVRDNGIGFNLNDVKKDKPLGLLGMEERAQMLNGKLRIQSSKLNGTTVRLNIPLRSNKCG